LSLVLLDDVENHPTKRQPAPLQVPLALTWGLIAAPKPPLGEQNQKAELDTAKKPISVKRPKFREFTQLVKAAFAPTTP
jgi:hypothetical protein